MTTMLQNANPEQVRKSFALTAMSVQILAMFYKRLLVLERMLNWIRSLTYFVRKF